MEAECSEDVNAAVGMELREGRPTPLLVGTGTQEASIASC